MGTVFRRKAMIQRSEYYVMSYLTTVTDGYTSVVLEMAAGVDEYVLTHLNVLPEIGIERGEYTQAVGHRFPEQFRQKSIHFFRGMVSAIQPESNLPGFITHSVHQFVNLWTAQCLSGLYKI